MKKSKIVLISILTVLAALLILSVVYVLYYYHPDDTAIACLESSHEGVTITTEADGRIVYMPEDPKAGFIFYPGAKVDIRSYSPLLCSLAEQGICCVEVSTTFHIPLLSIDVADGIIEEFPQIDSWYIGGHSLGGCTAAIYLGKHIEDYEGLILLGAYSITDLSDTNLPVLTIYGENDKILNYDRMEKENINLPKNTTVVCIPGGCHAGFADYGAQRGDGEPSITSARQQQITVETIIQWIADN